MDKISLVINVIYSDIKKNKNKIKQMFSMDKNVDFNLREFKIEFKDHISDAFLIYYDGMSSQNYLNRDIMRSLLTCRAYDTVSTPKKDIITERIISVAPFYQLLMITNS